MKKLLLLALLALALPMAAFAGSGVDYTNSGGTLSGSSSGLTLSGSVLIAVNGLNGGGLITGNDLGSVSFSTGALTSGITADGRDVRGWWVVHHHWERQQRSSERNPVRGTFDGPVTWTLVTLANGTHNYTLTGSLTGTSVSAAVFGCGCDGTVHHQYWQRLFQWQHDHFER